MTDRYLCNSMSKRTIRFKGQIGNYSMYACKGYYTSPKFGDAESESKWSLLVLAYDGADHENVIDVQLIREDFANEEEQFANVKISIVSCIGIKVFKSERNISFRDHNGVRILAVAKAQLKGFFGLKKFFYLPKDTLTLQCDLEVVHEKKIHLSSYQNEASFNNVPPPSECFVHSRFLNEADYFFWTIPNFSIQTTGGNAISPEYQSEHLGDSWNLVLYNTNVNHYVECMDIRLRRRESAESCEGKLLKAKLSVKDPSGKVLLFHDKNVFFTSPGEKQLLSLTERDAVRSWFGLRMRKLVQDDTFTLRCDLHLCKQIDDNLRTKEDFDKSTGTYGYNPKQLMPYLLAFVLCCICITLLVVSCLPWLNPLLSFIWLTVCDVVQTMIIFLVAVVLICFGILKIKQKGKEIRNYSRERYITLWVLSCCIIIYQILNHEYYLNRHRLNHVTGNYSEWNFHDRNNSSERNFHDRNNSLESKFYNSSIAICYI